MLERRNKYRQLMLHTTAFIAVLSYAHIAQADPTGGSVTSGTANISSSGQTTTITQSTDRAIIRWNTFDIGSSEHVQFVQPGSTSITVNRIKDTKASAIDGKLSANGRIVLINPNGLVFGSSAIVDVGGLVATTSDLEDDNAFMAGGALKFTKPGVAGAKIINNGTMTAKDGGLIGLIAPNVENNGVIQAKLGKVQLASGDIHTIDFAGDGLIKLEISDDMYARTVKNTGTITADGGEILLTAAAARGLVDTLVLNTGTLRADTITLPDGVQKAGRIELSAIGLPDAVTYVTNGKAAIDNTGHISTNGTLYDQVAGSITVLADSIRIGDGSVIEASGDSGGGSIRIGGDYQGGNGVPASDLLYVSQDAIIEANARRRGNGGRIIFWSDDNTRFYGHAEAMGGAESGNGGLIEISGKKFLDFDGTINLLAAHGQAGYLLLDPTNISIAATANANVNGSSPFAPNADDVTSVLNISTLTSALASGNVIVQTRATGAQAGNISVDTAITWSSGNTLTLDAHNNIVVNQAISAGTGSVTMIAGGDVQFNANVSGTGTLTIQQTNDTQTMGVAGGAGTLNLSTTDLTRIVDGWGNILLGRTSSSVAMTVNARTWTDNLTLRNGTGTISIAGSQSMGANALTLTTNGGNISIGGVTGTGTVTATAGGGAITVGGAISTTGAVNLNTNGGNFSNSATIGSGALTLATAGGSLTLGAATTAAGTTSLNSGSGTMAINAALNAGANALSLTTTGANITSNASGVITSGPLTITTSGGNVSTNAAINANGVTAITTGAGTINLGAAMTAGTGSLGLTTIGAAITTAGLTGGAITVNSNNANISIGSMTASGNSSVSSGNGTINIGTTNTATNTLSLTTTGFAITTAAITSGALTITSGGALITTNGNIAASGTTTINSGGANININAALGSGTGTLNLTTGGGALTTATGAITSGAFNISTSGGNVSIGGAITATGVGSILSGAGTVTTAAINTGSSALGITTVARTISTGNLTSGALTLASGGANISTGTLSFSGTSSITAGAGTINIGAATGGTNALTLSNTGVNNITTAAITSGNLSITSGGGIVATNGAIAAAGTSSITSGGGAINLNNSFTSTGTMTLTSGGGTITKANTGAMSSAALNVTTSNGGFSVGTGGLTTTGTTTINTGTGSAAVNSTWTATGQAIGVTTNNNTISLQVVNSGAITLGSSGGNITLGGATNSTFTGAVNITSGAGSITLTGAGTIGATTSAVNLTTTGGAINKNAALTTSTGAIAMNTSGGAIVLGTGILQSTTTGGITLNSGGGNITVGGGGIQTATGTVTLNSGAAGVITVNNIINLTGAGTLNITTDTDISLNIANALTGVGATLNVSQFTAGKIIGIGAGATGDILFSAAEYAMIKDGWGSLVFGTLTATGGINVTASAWTDSVTFRSLSGVINLANAMSFAANNLTITTDSNINLGGLLTGTGTLTITPTTNSTGIGIGTGQSGAIAFTDTEKGYLHTTWGNIIIGSTTQTGDINIGATSWLDPMTFRTNTGVIYVNGAQTMAANNLAFSTNADLVLNGNLTGTSSLTISSSSATMGFGDTMVGTLNLTNAELSRIISGWSSIALGTTSSTGIMNVGTYTWNSHLTLSSNTGVININGVQTMAANKNLTINTNANLNIGADLVSSGTSTLTISGAAAGTSIGIGDAQAGTLSVDNSELDYIQSNWTNVIFGVTNATGAMNIGAYTWTNANVFFRTGTGVMSIAGATMGNNNLTLSTDGNLAINGALSGGTGTLTIRASANTTVTAIGDGQTGTLQVSSTELAYIQNNWANVVIGHSALTGATNVGALTWGNNLTFTSNTGAININDTQDMGTYNLTFTTNGNPTFAAGLAGTGNLTIQSTTNNIDIGIGDGQAGNVLLSNSDLGNILNGWNSIIFSTTGTGADINLGAYTWQYDTLFRTGAGILTIAGDQTTNQDMTFEANSNIAVNANLSGSGTLTFRGQAVGTTMTVAGTGGSIVIDATELGRITDGWNQIVFGRSDGTGALTASAYTWSDDVRYMTAGGVLTISGAQTMGSNNLTLTTNSNLALNAALTGTGNLVIEGAAAATTIGLAGGTGTLALTTAELNQITDGWNSLTFGSVTGTGVVTVAAYTWKDNTTFISNGNIAVTGAQASNANTDVTYVTLAGNFVNSAGATPFSGIGAGGRYLIYSRAAGTDTYGGFTPPTSISAQTYFSQAPSSIPAGQSRIIYSSGAAKILYLQIDDKTKVYGDSLPTFSYTYLGGLQGGDLLSNAITSYSLSAAGAAATDSVGITRSITGSFGTGLGYSVSVINGTLSVTKAPILVVAANASQAYGDINPGTTINYVGLRNGETSAVIDTLATASSGTDQYTNVGTYAIGVSGAIDNNYTFNYSSGTLTINKAVLTATTQDATREFGLANPTFSLVYTGFKNGEDESVINTLATASSLATATSNVGNYAITGAGGLDNNYSFTFANTGLLSVTKATLTGTTQNATREYGLANPTFSIVYTGFRNADTVAVVTTAATLTSGTTLTSNAGDYTISASGANATNYQFVYDNSGLLSITKATLTATSQNATRQYGDADPALTFNYSGFRNGETSAVIDTLASGTTAATATSGVGSYTINGGGAVDNNYTFVYTNSGLLTISKATLTATTQSVSREYGLVNPALGIVYTGFKNGEDESVINTLATATTGANIFSDVGNYAITASGGLDDNYNITYSNTGLLGVTKATITVTGQNATREYGLANPSLSVVYTGFRNGDTESNIDTLASVSTPATMASDVGTYNINGSGALDNNYQFSYTPGTLTITKATLTATTQNDTREYGLANPTLNVVYTGFRNGDDDTDIDTLATATTAATILSNVGTYGISSSGAIDGNYQFTYANTGNLSVTKATLTATTQNDTREYGLANPTLNVVYTGFRNGDDDTDIDTLASATTAATILSNVGTYGISASGATDGNYQFTYANTGNLSITKATLTATTQNATREYGLANPTLSVVYTGFRNGDDDTDIDTLATATTAATILSNVGTYGISSSGASDGNYQFTYANTGNLSVTKATLTATTQNDTREYGLANPTLSIVYTGFRNGDDDTDIDTLATATTAATILSNVGTYGISASGASDGNYQFTYANTGNLSITKATLTATTQNATREYGLANPTLSVVYTGFRNGDDDTDIDTLASATTAATILSNVGTYGISSSGASDGNYQFTYANTGNLSVTKATLTATTQNDTREYGLANPTLNVVYTGFRNGDDDTDIDTLATATTAATILSNVGTYGISASGATDGNYQFTYANTGNLSITKATLTATTQNATREYGLANPTLSVVYTGFRNGDDDTDIDTLATATTAATILSNVGTYGVSSSGASDNNYQFTYANTGSLSVTKATLSVRADNKSREFSQTNPALTATYTGFRNGDGTGDINTLAGLSTAAVNGSAVGNYAITVGGAADNNYQFTYINGTLAIVADGAVITPPPAPTPTPPTSVPSTVEYSLLNPYTIIAAQMSPSGSTASRIAAVRPDIIFIPDDEIDNWQGSDGYLIAISDSLRREYYSLMQQGVQQGY